jgi:hypothetical protein
MPCDLDTTALPLFVLKQKVEQKIQDKSKCSAGFAGPTHRQDSFSFEDLF